MYIYNKENSFSQLKRKEKNIIMLIEFWNYFFLFELFCCLFKIFNNQVKATFKKIKENIV